MRLLVSPEVHGSSDCQLLVPITYSALEQQQQQARRATTTADVGDALAAAAAHRQQQRIDFHVGVLHFTPNSEPFPLLADSVEVSNSDMLITLASALPAVHNSTLAVPPVPRCTTLQPLT